MPIHSYKNPEMYSKNNSLQYHFATSVISHSEIDRKARILDLGCGDGMITCELARIAAEGCVIGADISRDMVEYAGKEYQNQNNLRFMQMDTSNNLFRDQFDVITSFNSLHWVKDQARALRGIANAVVENGKVILLLSHKKSQYHHALDIVCSQDKWRPYFKSYSNPRSFFEVKEYEKLLDDAGLKVTSLLEKELIHNFDSIERLKAFLEASMAHIKQIPQEKKSEFLEDFCLEFFHLSESKSPASIAVGFWCLEVRANKPAQIKKATASNNAYWPLFRSNL